MPMMFSCTCTPDSVLTDNVFGHMHSRYLDWLAETDLVDGGDTALVFSLVNEVLDDIVCFLQIPRDVAAYPVCGVCPLALHQVSNDGASAITGRSSPSETDGAVAGVCHTGVHNRPRRSLVDHTDNIKDKLNV